MDELVEVWDASGVPTGRTARKSEVHKQGWFHPTVHIWFYTASGKILLQKRAPEKDTFPGFWDVSVAGHVQAGELPPEAAIREIGEEIGLEMDAGALTFIGRFKAEHAHPGGIMDREFHYAYISELKVPLKSLDPQKGEVSDLQLKSLVRFSEETGGLATPDGYVPHGRKYYAAVTEAIQSRL